MVCLLSVSFLVGLAVVCHPADMFRVELVRASVHAFVRMLALTIICMIVCMIVCTIFFVGPGFESLALHHSLFGRSRVQAPDLAG